jgi:hypothetical protein
MKNKLLTISLAFLFLTIGLISAKDTTINHNYNEEFTIQKMEQIRNTFENNHQGEEIPLNSLEEKENKIFLDSY